MLISGFYVFTTGGSFLFQTLFLIWFILLCGASITMCVALWKMKSTIATCKKGKVNWKLMINHASSFILFLVVYFGSVAAIVLTEKSAFYTLWLL